MVTKEQILQWLQAVALVLEQNKDYLTQLDAAIGDADHGINMNRGFQKAIAQLPSIADKDIGSILKAVSMTLISTVAWRNVTMSSSVSSCLPVTTVLARRKSVP